MQIRGPLPGRPDASVAPDWRAGRHIAPAEMGGVLRHFRGSGQLGASLRWPDSIVWPRSRCWAAFRGARERALITHLRPARERNSTSGFGESFTRQFGRQTGSFGRLARLSRARLQPAPLRVGALEAAARLAAGLRQCCSFTVWRRPAPSRAPREANLRPSRAAERAQIGGLTRTGALLVGPAPRDSQHTRISHTCCLVSRSLALLVAFVPAARWPLPSRSLAGAELGPGRQGN